MKPNVWSQSGTRRLPQPYCERARVSNALDDSDFAD